MSLLRDYLRLRSRQAAAEITDEVVKSGALEQFKNPGKDTYNGVKMFAAMTGLSEDEVRRTFDEVKARRARK